MDNRIVSIAWWDVSKKTKKFQTADPFARCIGLSQLEAPVIQREMRKNWWKRETKLKRGNSGEFNILCVSTSWLCVFFLQLRVHYAQFLKRSYTLNKLLLHLFKLMPENPTCPGQGSELRESKTFFTESISLAVDSQYHTHTHTH